MSLALGLWAAILMLFLPFFPREATVRARSLKSGDHRPAPERIGPLSRAGSFAVAKLRLRLPNADVYLVGVSPAMVMAAMAAVVVIVVIKPLFGIVLAAALVAYLPLRKRARAKQRLKAIERQLPMVIDLYRVAINAGLNVTLATEAVAKRTTGPLGEELNRAVRQIELGERISDVLLTIPGSTSETTRPLFDALVSSDRYGSPLSTALERVSLESRVEQERSADRNAKRLSLLVVSPLAGTTLPAFLLLVAVPFFASSLGSLASQLS